MPDQAWSEIEDATSFLATHAPAHLRSAKTSDAVKLLTRFLSAGSALRKLMCGVGFDEQTPANNSLRDIESTYFTPPLANLSIDTFYASLLASLDGTLALSTHLIQNLARADDEFSPPLPHWNLWIERLTKIMQKYKLPFGARKDSDKRKRQSPFVLLVRDLQKHVPKECRLFDSDDAIAHAIGRARAWVNNLVHIG